MCRWCVGDVDHRGGDGQEEPYRLLSVRAVGSRRQASGQYDDDLRCIS